MRSAPAEEKMHTSKYQIRKLGDWWYLNFSGWYGMAYFCNVNIGMYREFSSAVEGIWDNLMLPAMKLS